MDSLVNQAAKYWYISNEQASVPLVVRCSTGAGGRFGAMHSQIPAPWFQAIPGMKIVAPAVPADAKGLLKAAIRDDNPVLFLEHKRLYALKGEYDPHSDEPGEIGRAVIRREGGDITIAAAMKGVHDSLAAAERLAADHGIEADVIDLRTLRPLDIDTILASVARTNRLLILEEGPLTGGWAGEALSLVVERSLEDIDDAWRLATPDLPIPYSPPLEDAHLPGVDAIVASVLDRLQ
jgi:acetoin:2,6-dichlorophenolindophenol oxidoreductase subunit beta